MAVKTKKETRCDVYGWRRAKQKMSRIVFMKWIQSTYIRDGTDLHNGQIITMNYSQHAVILFVCTIRLFRLFAPYAGEIVWYYHTYYCIITLSYHTDLISCTNVPIYTCTMYGVRYTYAILDIQLTLPNAKVIRSCQSSTSGTCVRVNGNLTKHTTWKC